MLVAFSVSPSGGDNPDASVHDAVAAAVHVVRESGLPNRTDSMFTTIEGEWDECMAVVKEATAAVAEYGPRVSLVLKADIRPGHTGELTGKLERLESALHSHELGRSKERRGITAGGSDGAVGQDANGQDSAAQRTAGKHAAERSEPSADDRQ